MWRRKSCRCVRKQPNYVLQPPALFFFFWPFALQAHTASRAAVAWADKSMHAPSDATTTKKPMKKVLDISNATLSRTLQKQPFPPQKKKNHLWSTVFLVDVGMANMISQPLSSGAEAKEIIARTEKLKKQLSAAQTRLLPHFPPPPWSHQLALSCKRKRKTAEEKKKKKNGRASLKRAPLETIRCAFADSIPAIR